MQSGANKTSTTNIVLIDFPASPRLCDIEYLLPRGPVQRYETPLLRFTFCALFALDAINNVFSCDSIY